MPGEGGCLADEAKVDDKAAGGGGMEDGTANGNGSEISADPRKRKQSGLPNSAKKGRPGDEPGGSHTSQYS